MPRAPISGSRSFFFCFFCIMRLDYKTIIACSVLTLTTACGNMVPRPATQTAHVEPTVQPAPPAPTVDPPAIETAVVWWLDYYRTMSDQPQNVLTKEYKSAENAISADKSLQNRLRLITLLSLRDTAFHNPEQAVKLLDGVISETEHPRSLRDAATILRNNLLVELEDTKKIQTLSGQVKEMQSSTREMQNQLNALKEIVRYLYDRYKLVATIKR